MVSLLRDRIMTSTRILIVDDIPEVREDLHTLLALAGNFEVVGEAVNGADAIHQAMTSKPDVILMDMEMPVMDGYEATRQIKVHDPACRVVALTVHGYEDARKKAFQAGVDIFIVKGAPVRELVQAISSQNERDKP